MFNGELLEWCLAIINVYVDGFNLYYGALKRTPLQVAGFGEASGYIRALKTIPNLQIKYGHFLTHSVPMYLTNVTPAQKVWVDKTVDKTEEKGSDVNLALAFAQGCLRQEVRGSGSDYECFGFGGAG